MLDLSQPHTVVVVTSTCRLPFVRGRLGPGVHHFEGDQRKHIRTVYHKKQLRTAAIHFIAGDTEQALRTIADLKHGKVAMEDLGDPSAMSEDPYTPEQHAAFFAEAAKNMLDDPATDVPGPTLPRTALSAESVEAALQELSDLGQEIGGDEPHPARRQTLSRADREAPQIATDEPMASGDDETLVIEDSQDKP